MARDVELLEAELLHDLDLVARHGALGIGFVIGAGLGLAAAAVAAQVRANNRVVLGEPRRDLRPHGVGLRKAVQQQEGRTGTAMTQADGDFVGLYCRQRESIEHDTLVTKPIPRGDDLEASRDAFPFVIHHGQYVLAGVDVQRLLVKSVRFAKVSVIEMPVNRRFPASMNGLENRASAAAVELARDQHPRIRVRIQQRERADGRRACASAIRAQRAAAAGIRRARGGSRTPRRAAARTSCAWVIRRGDSQSLSTRWLPRGIEIARAGCED